MTDQELSIAEELKTGLRRLTIATVVLFVVILGVGVKVWLVGTASNDALCAYRVDLQARVTQATEYLKDHPNGSKALGVTRQQLLVNISNQQRVISAFSGLSCSENIQPQMPETTGTEKGP